MKYYWSIIFLSPWLCASGQELRKGLLLPNPDKSNHSCCVHIPSSGLTTYDRPNGVRVAQLERGLPDGNGEAYQPCLKTSAGLTEVDPINLYMVGYEVMAFVYTDNQDGFVQTGGGLWLKIEEIESKGLVLKTWMQYLIESDDVLGWYANEPGLNLRNGPTTESEVLLTLKGHLFEITPTRETDGLWCKVEVTEYKEHPCLGEGDLKIKTLTGWVKLLADDQTPNVWDYGKGC